MDEDTHKPVVWIGDSRKQVQSFPREVKQDIGAALFDIQKGSKPPQAKPFKGVASGVLQIVTRFETNTYRTVYAVQIGKRIYVLHAFQKKAPKNRKTSKLDIEMIARRYKESIEIDKETKS